MESHLTFAESLLLSLNGLVVVFVVLVILSVATIIIAKIVSALVGKGAASSGPAPAAQTAAVTPAAPPPEEDLGDIVAVLQGALSLETGIPVDKLIITSVKSVPDAEQK